jgi:hypothetical protein
VVRQVVSEKKSTARIVSDTEQMKVHLFMSVLKLPLLVDLHKNVGEVVLSLTSCSPIIILENALN